MEIRRRYSQKLEDLKIEVLRMAAMTERAMAKAIQGLFERDSDLAEEVVSGDQEINLLEVEIDRLCLRLLALEQPMAIDLRFILHQRDETVHRGIRTTKYSLRGCIDCHAERNDAGEPGFACRTVAMVESVAPRFRLGGATTHTERLAAAATP